MITKQIYTNYKESILSIYYLLDDNDSEDDSVAADFTTFIGFSEPSLDAIAGGTTKAFFPKIESMTFRITIIKITFTQTLDHISYLRRKLFCLPISDTQVSIQMSFYFCSSIQCQEE